MPYKGETYDSHARRDLLVAAFIAASPVIFKHVMKIVKQPEDAEDLMQDTYIKAARAFPNHRGDNKISSWLYGIAHNLALDFISKNRYKYEVTRYEVYPSGELATETTPEEEVIDNEAVREIVNELNSLSEAERKAILMQAYNLNIEEIAESLGMPAGTVKSHVSRGRKKLNKNKNRQN
jgi:RNA polymerase sigma-70 factor (ECF subfamily)